MTARRLVQSEPGLGLAALGLEEEVETSILGLNI